MRDTHTRTFSLTPEEVVKAVSTYLRDKYPAAIKETEDLSIPLVQLYVHETHPGNRMCSISINATFQKVVEEGEVK
jgi:hypothetical protein